MLFTMLIVQNMNKNRKQGGGSALKVRITNKNIGTENSYCSAWSKWELMSRRNG